MDPFTIALATFGIQKLRGKSTKRSLRDAAIAGGIGQLGGMAGVPGMTAFGKASSMPANGISSCEHGKWNKKINWNKRKPCYR